MNTNHTTPWKLGEFSEHGGYDCMTCGIKAGPARLDGAAYGQGTCKEISAEQKARLMADARLIAAAPELLAFAQMFLNRNSIEDFFEQLDACIDVAQAVVAKATGDQS